MNDTPENEGIQIVLRAIRRIVLYSDESGWETTTGVIDENLLPPLTRCLSDIRQLPRFPVAGSRSDSFGDKQNDTIQEDSVTWQHLPVHAATLLHIIIIICWWTRVRKSAFPWICPLPPGINFATSATGTKRPKTSSVPFNLCNRGSQYRQGHSVFEMWRSNLLYFDGGFILSGSLKYSLVNFTTTGERSRMATRFGHAISPFATSENVHTKSSFTYAPTGMSRQ
jgi:hypothetical protein